MFLLIADALVFLIFLQEESNFTFYLFLLNFINKNAIFLLVPLTSEIYPTLFRTLGYGYASGVGRIGAFLSGFVLFPLFFISKFLPFLAVFCIISGSVFACY